jgi:outer membrane lipoprotein-sorting protein
LLDMRGRFSQPHPFAAAFSNQERTMSYRTPRSLRVLGAVVLVAALAGCGKTTTEPTPTSQQDADDAAQQVALTMSQDHGGNPQAAMMYGGSSSAASSARTRINTERVAAVASDTTFSNGNITWTLTRTFWDADNNPHDTYDPLTSVRLTATSRATGEFVSASDSASFGSAGSLDVHGILASAPQDTVNAARNDTLQAVFTPPFRGGRVYIYSECAGTLADVIHIKPVSSNPWPISGTATWTLHVSRLRTTDRHDVQRTFDVAVVIVFNGTRYPDVTVTGGFKYKFDLKTGVVQRRA